MERKFYTDDFEQLLKEKSDEFRMYPSKRVWHSIYNDLHPGRKWPSVAVSLILIIALLIVGYWNNNSADTSVAVLPSQTNIASRESNGAVNNSLFLSPFYLTAAAQPTTVAQQPVFNFNNAIFSPLGAATVNSTSSAALHPAAKNNATNNTVFENIAIANIGMINPQPVIVPEPISFSNEPNTNTADVSAKVNSVKQTTGATASIKAVISSMNKENVYTIITEPVISNNEPETVIADNNTDAITNTKEKQNTGAATATINGDEKTAADIKETTKPVPATAKKIISTEDRAWIEDYAFHNKSKRKKWQDRTKLELYITPNVGYRKLSNDPKYNMPAATPSFTAGVDANKAVDHTPGLGLEAGFAFDYSLAKNLRVKAGIQANYTSYGINAEETNHPVLTTLMLIDPNSGFPYMHSAASTLVNSPGAQSIKVHNRTYQVSIPLGFALKLSGDNKLEWYAGATIQPTFVLGGKAYLISADRRNYVADPSLIRKWNLNAGFETYINYKFDGFTLQAGPQFRYQLLSTYYKRYTVNENLSNIGIKLGVIKNF
jgi:hypothetical protein